MNPTLAGTVVLGILNVTPDSFSDGGDHAGVAAAVAHARAMRDAGADLIDVGGESTRPGADRIPAPIEQARVLPVIRELVGAGIRVSVDTMNASTALAAVASGAVMINDVSGGLADPAMPEAMASTGVDVVAMHWRGHSTAMDELALYRDVVTDVCEELTGRRDALVAAGVPVSRIILDPGIGFAKTNEHNWALLSRIAEVSRIGQRVLIGTSRKRFLRALPNVAASSVSAASSGSATSGASPRSAASAGSAGASRWTNSDLATAVTSALAAERGLWGVRVHDVSATRIALDVATAWKAGS